MKWINSLLSFWLVLGLVVSMVPREAAAQFAPSGAHYAGRPSDTGYGGTFVNATGVYAASVSLDLPAERAGLPVPLQIVYGGRGVGAAGLGWDIPLSYIKRDRTLAHRRPAYGQYVLPEARERVYLSLLGQGIELIPNGQTWVARNGTLELTVRKSADTWLVYDGEGRTYTFIQPANIDKSLWLLKSVSVAGGANVQLAYQINTWPIDGGSGIEINLIRIGYNTTPAPAQPPFAGCAKHEVALTYGNGSTKPLSVSMNTGSVHVRFRTLTLVDVKSRATSGAAFQSLRRYEFQYLTDVDTKLPRLRTVRMFGRQGTPEANTVLPIASYEYGAATRDGTLRYEVSQTVVLPPDDDGTNISNTAIDPTVNAPVSGTGYAMWQSLTDVTGDGRPDFVFKRNDKLWVAFNQPAPAGKTDLRVPVPLSDATFANGAFSTHTTTERRFLFGTANRNTMNIWRQAIDVNGDGRIDIIDAAEEPKKWVVYLNTPGGPAGLEWQRRSFSVVGLGLALVSSGHVIDGGYVPLSRRTTGVSTPVNVCRKSNGTKWVSHDGTITSEWRVTDPQTLIETVVPVKWECDDDGVLISGPPADMPGCILDLERRPICPPSNVVAPERTFVEWELTDLNGDGYPDFVFNSLPLEFKLVEPDFDPDSDESGEKLIRQIRS